MAADVIPLKVAQRLERLYQEGMQAQAQAASIIGKFNEARAAVLETLGLDPDQSIGIDFKTGLIRPPPTEIRPAPAEDVTEPVATPTETTDPAEQPA